MDKRSKEYRELHPRQPKAENPSARETPGIGSPEPVRPQTHQEAAITTPVSRESEAHGNTGRPERVSIGAKQEKLARLAKPYMEGEGTKYHHIFVEDDDKGNVDSYIAGYYEFVKQPNGDKVSYPSGQFKLVLMRIPMEYYEEDMALQAKESSDMIMTKIELNRAAGEYSPSAASPDGGNSALSRNEGVFDPTL